MDFTSRPGSASSNQQIVSPSASKSQGGDNKKKRGKLGTPFSDMATTLLFIAAAVVLLGLTWLLIFYRGSNESKYVDTEKLQAVFLNGGQVYFGNIIGLNDGYLRLGNIYYLRVNQQVQPRQGEQASQDISLVKLGCELHGPEDSMVINREQVLFWENLKSDGQVTEAVKQYVEANPNGQDCSTQSSNGGTNGSSADDSSSDASDSTSTEDTTTDDTEDSSSTEETNQ